MSMFDIVFCYSTNLENENIDLNPIEISPNPIDGEQIYLHGVEQDEKWELQLIDFKGQIVLKESKVVKESSTLCILRRVFISVEL